jgi:RHS repeat-associated protein
MYGKPTQEELDRLFGNEVGNASHYMKNVVVDPNGQASVSYVDAHGRTIATGLSGPAPASLLPLPSLPGATSDTMNLLNNIREATKLVSTNTLLVTNATNTYTFDYKQTPKSFDPACKAANVCYDCLYDLKIEIEGVCTGYAGYSNSLSYSGVTLDSLCNNITTPLNNNFTITNLPIGEYRVTKTLSLSQTAIDYYLGHYLKNNSCLPSLATLTSQFLAASSSFCNNGCPDCQDLGECAALAEMIKADVSPGGQYATFSFDANGNFVAPNPADVTSIFNGGTPSFRTPCTPYKNEDGSLSYIMINGVPKAPEDAAVSINDFIKNWQPSWAASLICKHPENCYLNWCQGNTSSNNWDDAFYNTTTYSAAVTAGYFNPMGGTNPDPFFQSSAGSSYLIQMTNALNAYSSNGCDILSLSGLIASIVYCNGDYPCNVTPGSGCTSENDLYWQMYQMAYQGLKFQMKSAAMEAYATANNCSHNTTCFCIQPGQSCTGTPCANKLKRVITQTPSTLSVEQQLNNLYNSVAGTTGSLPSQCDLTCTENAKKWVEQLLFTCPTMQTYVGTSVIDTLIARFTRVCKNGCDGTHMYGSTSVNPTLAAANAYDNLKEALNSIVQFSTLSSPCDTLCNVDFIAFPGSYTSPQYTTPKMFKLEPDSCACTQLTSLKACWNSYSSGMTFQNWLNQFSDLKLTAAQITDLENYCLSTNTCDVMPTPIAVPPSLECGTCKTCVQVQAAEAAFTCGQTQPGYKLLYAARLNSQLGLNLTYDEYQVFLHACSNSAIPTCAKMLCPKQLVVPATQDTACWSILVEQAQANAQLAYESILDSLQDDFLKQYFNQCLNLNTNPVPPTLPDEAFTVIAPMPEHHYTLYYYDQAGNLVRTVPPAGIASLNESQLYKVKKHRASPIAANPPVFPAHTLVTRYWYNTFDKPTREEMPDQGATAYWYDKLGRPVASQLARQNSTFKFNYMLYDPLGRVIESGQKTSTSNNMNDATAQSSTLYTTWLGTTSRAEVVKTFYDDKINPAFTWQNVNNTMRSRVASSTYSDSWSATATSYTYATHYDYDIAGNVKTLVQEIPELLALGGNNFKRMDYDYDLISGKVNAVYYQRDSIDQFIHRYTYDADNRLDYVETSRDGYFWERDATYDYYKHGPLARTELGERRVQGLDYAYTLQGWLKGVNAGAFNTLRDMGRDGDPNNIATGVGNPNKFTGLDAIGFTLGYFQGDYTPVTTLSNQAFELATASTSFNSGASDLFNGNIRHAVYAIKKLESDATIGYAYKYDQLNRLRNMDAWRGPSTALWNWSTPAAASTDYKEEVAYDANGNILNYRRNGGATQNLMDSLTYKYYPNSNRLRYIDDNVTASNYSVDLDDQSGANNAPVDNYIYDASGYLTSDASAKIDAGGIQWTADGKLKSVTKLSVTGQPTTTFKYDAMRNRVVKQFTAAVGPTDITTYYIRDAQGNVMATYEKASSASTVNWKEAHIYGSSRLGMEQPNLQVNPRPYTAATNPNNTTTASQAQLLEGWKRYELTNHLGNVLSVITDRKLGREVGTADNIIDQYDPEIIAAQDYYPFGMVMPCREYTANFTVTNCATQLNQNSYRYGFNGKEEDDEIKGDGNQQEYGMRIYDPRVGRFLSVDPLTRSFPWWSPYQFAGNGPIVNIDLDGLEKYWYNLVMWDQCGKPILELCAVQRCYPSWSQSVKSIFGEEPPRSEWNGQPVGGKEFLLVDGNTTYIFDSFEKMASWDGKSYAMNTEQYAVGKAIEALEVAAPLMMEMQHEAESSINSIYSGETEQLEEVVMLPQGKSNAKPRTSTSTSTGLIKNVDEFIGSQKSRLNEKLGLKIRRKEIPFAQSKQGQLDAVATVKKTLENPTLQSGIIPKSTASGDFDLIHVYSSKTNYTVSLRVLGNGKYEFDTLIEGKTGKVQYTPPK